MGFLRALVLDEQSHLTKIQDTLHEISPYLKRLAGREEELQSEVSEVKERSEAQEAKANDLETANMALKRRMQRVEREMQQRRAARPQITASNHLPGGEVQDVMQQLASQVEQDSVRSDSDIGRSEATVADEEAPAKAMEVDATDHAGYQGIVVAEEMSALKFVLGSSDDEGWKIWEV
jgi:chromosome segregation ATPase